uniref:Uncharacterized protein n=1 Tax=Micrurus carvalhoi TaxID=3147026 RepID=A0A2H6N0D1_9SAUR
MDGPLVESEGRSLGLNARLKKGEEKIRDIKLDSSSFRDRFHGNEEKRLLRVKTEKKEKKDLEFEMELSAGGKPVSGDKEDRNTEDLTGWVEKPTCKERSSLRIF